MSTVWKKLDARQLLSVARHRLTAPKTGAIPYFTGLLESLILYETEAIPTTAVTEHSVMFFNPKFIKALADEGKMDEIEMAYAHEAMHKFLGYFDRVAKLGLGKHSDPNDLQTANIAHDAEIARVLVGAGLRVDPDRYATWQGFVDQGMPEDHKLLEQIYRWLKTQDGGQAGQGQGSAPDQAGAPTQAPQDQSGAQRPSQGPGHAGACGCHGPDGDGLPEELRRISEEIGRDASECEAIVERAAREVADYAEKNPGRVPGGVLEFASSVTREPEIDWTDLLYDAAADAIQTRPGLAEETWQRANQRYMALSMVMSRPPILPGRYDVDPQVIGLIDTSGSMTKSDYAQVLPEAQEILDMLEAPMRLACVDTKIQGGMQVVSSVDDIKFGGGGGTNFDPAFKHIAENEAVPDLVVLFTDGHFSMPSLNPLGDVPVIVVVVGRGGRAPWRSDWTTVVFVDPEARKRNRGRR